MLGWKYQKIDHLLVASFEILFMLFLGLSIDLSTGLALSGCGTAPGEQVAFVAAECVWVSGWVAFDFAWLGCGGFV